MARKIEFLVNGVVVKPTTNHVYDKAIKLRDSGLHLRKVANQLKIEYKGLTAKLKEYEKLNK